MLAVVYRHTRDEICLHGRLSGAHSQPGGPTPADGGPGSHDHEQRAAREGICLEVLSQSDLGILHMEWEGEINELWVTDVTGKVVLRTVPAHQQAAVQLGNFPTGLYFLRLFTGKKWEQAQFLVRR
ncbi:T9SS type A sorting domain-containing protein [Hymenobacter sp. GOD-10R]|uniref:T9SS type A sorting domain-containing protein n=1 Tax=Hymenobacter sp. GOD-10R TaxID=3093922 RepID=UPI002D798CB2|nr:T9SS type A sorting domain-containing protein [Hymenobacter sp. GOD-10R]WRQ31085.1 T9SS type A sorting domain-containing protein [Hymenobacter sp. GOD-10R]